MPLNTVNESNQFFRTSKLGRWFDLLTIIDMLEYFKTILYKVSFDKQLFEKELRKALKSLLPQEITQLKEWCYQQFGNQHQLVLQSCFV